MNFITNDPEFAKEAIEVLENVNDPEIGLNVVDLGLIYNLDIDREENLIYCTMTLTTRFCPMSDAITEGVNRALNLKFPHHQIKIQLSFDPPWSAERISEQGKAFLNQ